MTSPNLQHCTVSLLLPLYSQFRSIAARHQESARVSEKQAQAARASTGSVGECSQGFEIRAGEAEQRSKAGEVGRGGESITMLYIIYRQNLS